MMLWDSCAILMAATCEADIWRLGIIGECTGLRDVAAQNFG